MSIHLKHYEATDVVRAMITPDEMDQKVTDLSDYSTRDTLVNYAGKVNPSILVAWSDLLIGIRLAYGESKIVAEGLSVYLIKDRSELEDVVVQNLRSDRYWNPGKYPDITDDQITYGD